MRTIKLIVEYDGSDLSGWQRQKNGPTVQQHLEEALSRLTRQPMTIVGASRTDAGVHALGQVAHFQTESTIPARGFRRGVNNHLPPAIAVVGCHDVAPDFHARFDSRGKHYRYTLLIRAERSPLWTRRAWHCPRSLDLDAMKRAAEHCIGERDFSAFRAAGCTANTTTREITSIDFTQPADVHHDLLHIDVRGNAFLRNMVRILAGTLYDVGEGRIAADALPEILASRDRTRAGQTAPAHGLTLVEVFYGNHRTNDPKGSCTLENPG